MNNTKDVAKLLANRTNQEHYILHYLNEIYYGGVKKGKEQQLNLPAVSNRRELLTTFRTWWWGNREKATDITNNDLDRYLGG